MLHIFAWLAVFTAALFALGAAMSPWRTRRWFKLVFFPGVLLAIGSQVPAARLCVDARIKRSPLGDGKPVFLMIKGSAPFVAGALFILISHAFIFAFFALTVILFESLFIFDPAAIQLPSLYPAHLSEEPLQVSSEASVGLGSAPCVLLVYLFAPVFTHLRLRGREYFPAGLFLVVLGMIYLGGFLGFESPSQGWTSERLFHFPPWWGTFSLYVLMVLFALAVALITRALRPLFPLRRRVAASPRSDQNDSGPRRPEPMAESVEKRVHIVYE